MTGKEAVRQETAFAQGVSVDLTQVAPADRERAFTEACDYRGDVTLDLKDGTRLECFMFDRRDAVGSTEGCVRVMMVQGGEKRTVPYSTITRLTFSGKDTAAGKTWESWVRRYIEKRIAGERASIESEVLD